MARSLSKKEVCDFEKKYGTLELLKASVAVINHLLVEHGLTDEDELKQLMKKELDNRKKR